jgi:hypothetical protein
MYEKSTACNPCETQPHNVPTLIGALKDLAEVIDALEQTIVPYTETPLQYLLEGDYEAPPKMEMQPHTNNVIEQIVVMRKRVQYSIDMISNNIRRLCDVIGNY